MKVILDMATNILDLCFALKRVNCLIGCFYVNQNGMDCDQFHFKRSHLPWFLWASPCSAVSCRSTAVSSWFGNCTPAHFHIKDQGLRIKDLSSIFIIGWTLSQLYSCTFPPLMPLFPLAGLLLKAFWIHTKFEMSLKKMSQLLCWPYFESVFLRWNSSIF